MLCNANPRNKEKKKQTLNNNDHKGNNNDHKGKNNEAQGPCQKDSVSLSLLHPKLLDVPRALKFVFTLE